MPEAVHIENLRATTERTVSRVCADVDGAPLWFESPDVRLEARPEAFCSAMLPAAFARGASLIVDATIDETWTANVRAVQDVWRRWWGGRKVDVGSKGEESRDTPRAKGKALCFSGGVDSFYTLLRGGFGFDHLVLVHGYDIRLSDRRRIAAAEASVREIAAAVGAKAVVIRTNLREHPTFVGAKWRRAHGGALVAVGHLLSDALGLLVLSASYPYCYDHPWGSHWDTDPLWSSSVLEIVHFGADHWRGDKLRAIAGEELVRQHLRVCWENLSEHGNCGRCEKCIRTMLILAGAGQLADFPVFGGGVDLAERICELPPLRHDLVKIYGDFPRDGMDRAVAAALEALIVRSRFAMYRRTLSMKWLRRRISNIVLGCVAKGGTLR